MLTDENINEYIANSESILIDFYAPWCVHCVAFSPEYEKIAGILESKNAKTILAKIDTDSNPITKNGFSLRSFPTLDLFQNGEFVETYEGKRTTIRVMKFILSHDQDLGDIQLESN